MTEKLWIANIAWSQTEHENVLITGTTKLSVETRLSLIFDNRYCFIVSISQIDKNLSTEEACFKIYDLYHK
jgi:PhoPQ-activated pathogenicity-related protein